MSLASKTFAELYGERHHLAPTQFEQALFRATLYPHARLPAWVLQRVLPRFFDADFAYLRGVGLISHSRQLNEESRFFHDHPQNAGLLRTVFRVRVSTERVRALVKELLPGPSTSVSTAPFARR